MQRRMGPQHHMMLSPTKFPRSGALQIVRHRHGWHIWTISQMDKGAIRKASLVLSIETMAVVI